MGDAYLLDTNIATAVWDAGCPDHEAGRRYCIDLGDAARILVSVVTLAEVEYGLRTAPCIDPARQQNVQKAMGAYPFVIPITKHTVHFYAEIRAQLFTEHSPRSVRGRRTSKWIDDLIERTTGKALGVQENDVWIAAQALEMNLVLVTADRMDHISRLALNPALRIERWK